MDDAENANDIPREKDNKNAEPLPLTELQSILPNPKPKKSNEAPEPTEKRVREWLQLAVNAFLAFVGCFAVCIYYGQLQVSKRSVVDLEKQLTEMQVQRDLVNRAWIKIVDVTPEDGELGKSFEAWDFSGIKTSQEVVIPKGVQLRFKAIYQNVGHSPVLNMTAFYELSLSKLTDTSDSLLREEQRFCSSGPHRSEADRHATLFPEEPYEGGKRVLSTLRAENSVINGPETEFSFGAFEN